MTKSQINTTWIEGIYQPPNFQSVIFAGFEVSQLSPMTILISHFIDNIDLSCFNQYYKANKITGGRPNFDFRILLKIYMYSLYSNISINKIHEYNSLGSNLHYLSQNLKNFPERSLFSKFLNILDFHINDIFDLSLEYISQEITIDTSISFCDGTVFEACNSRHKVITDTNIARSNTKWSNVLNNPNASEDDKELAIAKLQLNEERTAKLKDLGRTSYGRTDEDYVILKDKNGSFIAGYNAQFVEENNYGLVVYAYISNKNPDSAAFLDMADDLVSKIHLEYLVLDSGYGTPEILIKLNNHKIDAVVKAVKNKDLTKKITDYSFELSEGEDYLVCPEGQILEQIPTKKTNMVAFKAANCQLCELKDKCLDTAKNKRVTINLKEFKAMKHAAKIISSKKGIELYSHRGNKCESPNGFIKYNLNGKKLKSKGLTRNNTILKLYVIIYNFRRLISIKKD